MDPSIQLTPNTVTANGTPPTTDPPLHSNEPFHTLKSCASHPQSSPLSPFPSPSPVVAEISQNHPSKVVVEMPPSVDSTASLTSLAAAAARGDDSKHARWSCKAPGLMLVFGAIAVCQVVVACVLIWYIGFRATTDTVQQLTTELRSSVLADCLNQINSELSKGIRSAQELHFMTEKRFPDLGTRMQVSNDVGWLADITKLHGIYPRIARFGFVGAQNILVGSARATSRSHIAVLAANGNVSYFLSEPTYPGQSVTRLLTFAASPIRTVNYNPPVDVESEIQDQDSPSDIARYLGPMRTNSSYTMKGRPFWVFADMLAKQRQYSAGWSDPFVVLPAQNAPGFVGLLSFHSKWQYVNNVPQVQWLTYSVMSAADFEPFLEELPFGQNGKAYLMRPGGYVVATSDPNVAAIIRQTNTEVSLWTSTDDFLQIMLPMLLQMGLVTTQPVNAANYSFVVPYRDTIYQQSFTYNGDSWMAQAQITSNVTTGSPYFVVILTSDKDFNSNLRQSTITTGWLSVVICFAAIIFSILVSRCVTGDLITIVRFMERAVGVIAMERGEEQRTKLNTLCEDWAHSTHTANIIHLREIGFSNVHHAKEMSEMKIGSCGDIGRSIREVDLMHRTFGSMLYSLASYDELEAINQAKRQFIRYIFHEVRVPFNAIVLGIEQMQLELKTHIRSNPTNPSCVGLGTCLDTMGIVHEQGEVVSRILNDVLSMQKIEDGALQLEISAFDMENMIRIALHAFRVPCADKRLKVDFSFHSLEQIIERNRARIPALLANSHIHLGAQLVDGAPKDAIPPAGEHTWKVHCEADPYRLRQAIANLLSNAIKFSRINGAIAVTLEYSNFTPAPLAPISATSSEQNIKQKPSVLKSSAGGRGTSSSLLPQRPSFNNKSHGNGSSVRESIAHEEEKTQASRVNVSGLGSGNAGTTTNSRVAGTSGHLRTPTNELRRISQAGGSSRNVNPSPAFGALNSAASNVTLTPNTAPILSRAGTQGADDKNMPRMQLGQATKDREDAYDSRAVHSGAEEEDDETFADMGGSSDSDADLVGYFLGTVNLLIKVKDSGIGLSPENAKALFQQYMQVNANQNQQGNGSGLGLNISKSIIELHGGRIGVTSVEGEGSEFYFAIPNTRVILSRSESASVAERDETVQRQSYARSRSASKEGENSSPLTEHSRSLRNRRANNRDTDSSHRHHRSNVPSISIMPPTDTANSQSMQPQLNSSTDSLPPPTGGDNETTGVNFQDSPQSLLHPGEGVNGADGVAHDNHNYAFPLVRFHADDDGTTAPDEITVHIINHPSGQEGGAAAGGNLSTSPSDSSVSPQRNISPTTPLLQSPIDTSRLVTSGANRPTHRATRSMHPPLSTIPASASPGSLFRDMNGYPHSDGTQQSATESEHSNQATPYVQLRKIGESSDTSSVSRVSSRKASNSTSSTSSKSGPAVRVGARVLVVEDSVPNRKLLLSILSHMKLVAVGVENGLECVNLFPLPAGESVVKEEAFDCIILDGNMPVMTGIEACQILRSRGVKCPVLALTGNALQEDIESFMKAGATQVLTKPVNRAQLQQTLIQYLPANPTNSPSTTNGKLNSQ